MWDMFPGVKSLGGAPANFAFHTSQLGARGIVVSCIGHDPEGMEIEQRFAELGLTTQYLRYADRPTGIVTVDVQAGQPIYTIHSNAAWDFLPFDAELEALAQMADAVCFGSLAQRTAISRHSIQSFLGKTRQDCLKVFDINLRQTFYETSTIEKALSISDVLKLNHEELAIITNLLQLAQDEITAVTEIMARFSLRLVALTYGRNGSSLYTSYRISHHPGYPVTIVDTVGAGDAFTSALVLGLLRDDDLDCIHDHASRLASFVCSQPGATPQVPQTLLASLC